MKVYSSVRQGSAEWFTIRRGRPTASRFKDIITASRGGPSGAASAYIHELIAESLTAGGPAGFRDPCWMDRGPRLEDEARRAFSRHTGLAVEQPGFVSRDDGLAGCSPDGLAVDPLTLSYAAGLEIKCPAPHRHVAMVARGVLPDCYKQQVHGGLVITGLPEWHFWSYCPGMQPFHTVVCPDEYTARLSAALDEFLRQYAEARAELLPKLKPPALAAA